MALTMEELQNLLNELSGEEVPSQARLIELSSEIRDNYHEMVETTEKQSGEYEELRKNFNDLSLTSSKMFRQLSAQQTKQETDEEKQQLSKSESITIEELEKGAKF